MVLITRASALARVCCVFALSGAVLAVAESGAEGEGSAGALSGESLMANVRAYAALGPDHLTGTTDAANTERWATEQLRAAGLQTGSTDYTFPRFVPQEVALSIGGAPVESVAARFYSGTTGKEGLAAPLAWAELGTSSELSSAEVAGRIAVIEVPTIDSSIEPSLDEAVKNAKADGAAGLVAVTEGPADYPVQEDIDARDGELGMPVLFVGKRSGAGVIEAAKAGQSAKLTLTAITGWGCDSDVYAVLPGQSNSRDIVIGTPVSGFDEAASERGAGVAALIGLARYFAAMPQSERPETLIFAATSGHEDGYLGLSMLMKAHPEWFAHADAYVHMGASIAARLITETPQGTTLDSPLDDPSRLLYVSENPVLQALAQSAFAGTGIAAAPPSVLDPGEQVYAYDAGIPIVSISGGSFYFHTDGDTPEGVDPTAEERVAQAYASAITKIAALPAGTVRTANRAAEELAAGKTPSSPGGGTRKPEDEPQPTKRCTIPRVHQGKGNSASTDERPQGIPGAGAFVPTYDEPQPAYPWEGSYQWRTFTTPSRATGAKLYGTIFAPLELKKSGPAKGRPVVVIGPGSGPGVQAFYQWSARDLAGHGYIAITIDPQGVGYSETFAPSGCSLEGASNPNALCPGVPFQQSGNYVDGLETGIDYALSGEDPWRRYVNASEVGIAGHSLSARAVSWLQGQDSRVRAAVAWDNLASNLAGDAGSPSGGGTAGSLIGGELPTESEPVTPRVPSLGEASDARGSTEPTNEDPNQKKTAYEVWRAADVPSMEVVFKEATHLDWAQSATTTAKGETYLEHFEYYTRAWFDRWLRGEKSATERLLARTVDGEALSEVLSSKFDSAAFLDGHDCPDLTSGCS